MYDFYDRKQYEIKSSNIIYSNNGYIPELKRRIKIEKEKKEIQVNYYRIFKKYTFSLPIQNGWDKDLPIKVENIEPYPYAIWLLWTLRERWDTLFASYKLFDDEESRKILENEILCAFSWDKYAIGRNAYLGTAHFAMCVARYMKKGVFEEKTKIEVLSREFLDKHFMPWFEEYSKTDYDKKVLLLHNIQVILVFSDLTLAKFIHYDRLPEIEEAKDKILKAYKETRISETPFTEMAAYDAYALDAITDYVELCSQEAKTKEYTDELKDVLNSLTDTTIPGRCDLLAPIGDVEEEMQFHSYCLYRLSKWLCDKKAKCVLLRISPIRLPSLVLFDIITDDIHTELNENYPITSKNAGTCVIREGMNEDDKMICFSIGKWNEGHVHYDSGSFVYGYKGEIPISDPGYQQYIKGEEREFKIGKYSHNAPIINGKAQSRRNIHINEFRDWFIKTDLSDCYELENGKVFRTFEKNSGITTVTDIFENFEKSIIEYSFTIPSKFSIITGEGLLCLSCDNFDFIMEISTKFEEERIEYAHGDIEMNRIIFKCELQGNREIKFKMHVEDKK